MHLMTSTLFLAQAGGAQPSPWLSMLPMILIIAVFYFLLIAPMRKRQKELQKVVESLKKGDRVVTNGGLHGEVAGTEGSVVYLKIADQVKVKVSKSAISGLEEQGGGS
jgi:preprotein translocase subunit YajC